MYESETISLKASKMSDDIYQIILTKKQLDCINKALKLQKNHRDITYKRFRKLSENKDRKPSKRQPNYQLDIES